MVGTAGQWWIPGSVFESHASGYYFLHIPKTGGISLSAFLDQIFVGVQTSTIVLWDQLWPSLRDRRFRACASTVAICILNSNRFCAGG
jgi:hypothetical protein